MVSWADRRFLDLVGVEVPIVQAPMAGAGGVELCVAAIDGGALGSLPCGMLSAEQVRDQVAEVRRLTNRPFNLNFFCHSMPEGVDDSAWRALLQGAPLGQALPAAELTRRLAADALAIMGRRE
jgi:nitronate monooxygenase